MSKIIVADDDEDALRALESVLREGDYQVRLAVDGPDLIRKMENEAFDLIITDLQMPRMNPSELIEAIMKDRQNGNTPCIISSGHIDDFIISEFSNNPRIHFLPKPQTKAAILDKVKSLLSPENQATPVDVRFLNPILAATIKTIETMATLDIKPGTPYTKKNDRENSDISGVVGVVSAGFKGTITLSFDQKSFLAVVSKMLGTEYTQIDGENRDAVAELLNMIFGQAKAELNEKGFSIRSAIPSIVVGKGHAITHQSPYPTIVIPFTGSFGSCTIEICSSPTGIRKS